MTIHKWTEQLASGRICVHDWGIVVDQHRRMLATIDAANKAVEHFGVGVLAGKCVACEGNAIGGHADGCVLFALWIAVNDLKAAGDIEKGTP